MTTTLITGANKGLGFEASRRLIAAGHDVWMAARDPALGRAAADEIGGRFVQLDVTDEASVQAAARTVGPLDVLINNAGIAGRIVAVDQSTGDDVDEVMRTNVSGIVRVTNAFLPALRKSAAPVIVNVASGLGSIVVTSDPQRIEHALNNVTYSPSKAAVVMLTTQYARGLPEMRVNAVDPGYTATDLNGHQGPQSVTEGTDAIVAMATIAPDGPSGTFTDRHGQLPW